MKKIYFTLFFLIFFNSISYSQWLQLTTNTNTSFYTVKFFNANTGLVAGQDTVGKIFRTTNGGLNWTLVYRTNYSEKFMCFFFVNDNTGWAGTYNSSVYKTTNSGINWLLMVNNLSVGNINSFSFINSLTGWLISSVGGAGHTTDGGASWYMNAPNFPGTSIHFINDLTGVIATYQGTIRKSVSAGNGYTEIFQLPANTFITDFHFLNSNTGYACGYRKMVLKTTNTGSNWSLVNLDPPGPPSENFYKVFFIDENLGYGAGQWIYSDMTGTTAYGMLRKTTNGGLNWTGISLNPYPYSFEDITVTEGQTAYIVGLQNRIFKSTNAGYIGVEPVSEEIPSHFSLHQNYPNPFNPVTKIKFEIPAVVNDNVELKVFDILGREVNTLVNENLKPGVYEVDFNASDMPSGVYFYKLTSGEFVDTKKMILLK